MSPVELLVVATCVLVAWAAITITYSCYLVAEVVRELAAAAANEVAPLPQTLPASSPAADHANEQARDVPDWLRRPAANDDATLPPLKKPCAPCAALRRLLTGLGPRPVAADSQKSPSAGRNEPLV